MLTLFFSSSLSNAAQCAGHEDVVLRRKLSAVRARYGHVPQSVFGVPPALRRSDNWVRAVEAFDGLNDEILPSRVVRRTGAVSWVSSHLEE